MFDLRSKPVRFSSECSLGIKVHACDPNMLDWLLPSRIINEFEKELPFQVY